MITSPRASTSSLLRLWPASTRAATLATLVLLLSSPATAGVGDHVRRVAATLADHLPDRGPRPGVEVVETAAVTADAHESGTLEVSTGLLAALRSDAELAMVLAYEQARFLQDGERRGPGRADARDGGGRRDGREARRADDRAAELGMRALIAAGYDGHAALEAWSRLTSASVGGSDDGYGDARANRKRQRRAKKVLKRSGQHATRDSGHVEGRDSYERGVLANLSGWHLDERVAERPAAPSPRRASPPPLPPDPNRRPREPDGRPSPDERARGGWLMYERSGGITGWHLVLRIDHDGTLSVHSTRSSEDPPTPAPLSPQRMDELRDRVERALEQPPRRPLPEARHLRDGQSRRLTVQREGLDRVVVLSDGHALQEGDAELIRSLEAIAAGR